MCSEDIQETIREMVDECEANVRRICSSLSALHLVDIMISIKCWRQPGIQSFPRVTQKRILDRLATYLITITIISIYN